MPDLIISTNFNAFTVHKWTYGRHLCWLAFCQRSLLSITIKWERIYFLAHQQKNHLAPHLSPLTLCAGRSRRL